MIYTRYEGVEAFLRDAGDHLARRETEVSLLYGIALRLAAGQPYSDEPPYFACVHAEETILATAVRTPPHSLILDLPTQELPALCPIVDDLAGRGVELTGVHARSEIAESFGAAWCLRTGCQTEIGRRLRTYVLTEVVAPRPCPGRFRVAGTADRALLCDWARGFQEESLPGEPHRDPSETVDRFLEQGTLHVWEDGDPVSMAATTRPMPRGASIGMVYTPKSLRGHGYASACVASLSQRMLDGGKAYCTLYTDLANPVSNAIYQRIGYRPLADFLDLRFVRPAS